MNKEQLSNITHKGGAEKPLDGITKIHKGELDKSLILKLREEKRKLLNSNKKYISFLANPVIFNPYPIKENFFANSQLDSHTGTRITRRYLANK